MNIYVGNLSYTTKEQDLINLFEPFGQVVKATIITDKITGKSRGFAFVQMATREEGQAAIDGLHGKDYSGRMLTVNEARQREEGSSSPRESRGPRRDRDGGNRFGGNRGGDRF